MQKKQKNKGCGGGVSVNAPLDGCIDMRDDCIIMHKDDGDRVDVLPPLPPQFEGQLPANAHSEDEIFAALDRAAQNGNIMQTAREMGINRNILRSWIMKYKEELEAITEVQKIELAGLLGCQVKELVGAINKAKIEAASLKDIGIVAGILADKWKDLTNKGSGKQAFSMRIAWQDGSGAVELTTGGQE